MPHSSARLLAAALALALVLAAERLHGPAPDAIIPDNNAYPTGQLPTQPAVALPPSTTLVADLPNHEGMAAASLPQTPPHLPRVTIIIDDMGYNLEIGQQLLHLDLALSFSFLPQAPQTPTLARLARAQGRTVLVHLPMEPRQWRGNEEQETLRVGDSETALDEKTGAMLAAVPFAQGANNHMGSRFTEDRRGMRRVLANLRTRSLFYIDSVTSAASVGEATARQLGVPTTRRTVFLDNEQHSAAICRQLDLLAAKATAEGQAIAIGHPHPAMVEALTTCGRKRLAGVRLTGVEELVR